MQQELVTINVEFDSAACTYTHDLNLSRNAYIYMKYYIFAA